MKNSNIFPTNRQLKVSGKLRQLISSLMIREEHFFNLSKGEIVSVVDVDVSPDLRNAKIFVSLYNVQDQLKILNNLNSKVGFIKKKLSKDFNLKFFPNLKFCIDNSVEYSKKIYHILDNL